MDHLNEYINSKASSDRQRILAKCKLEGHTLPISLVEDVLCLQIPAEEKHLLIEVTDNRNRIALEDFLLSGIGQWDQDLASYALRKWVTSTDHLLWHRLLQYALAPHVAQRIQYTILDQCSPFCGSELVAAFHKRPGLSDLSQAFHSLIFLRSGQRSLTSDDLNSLAIQYAGELRQSPSPDNKAIAAAIGWLARHDLDSIRELFIDSQTSEVWRELLRPIFQIAGDGKKAFAKLTKALGSSGQQGSTRAILEAWPSLWARHTMGHDLVVQSLTYFLSATHHGEIQGYEPGNLWRLFAGIDSAKLATAICAIESPTLFAQATNELFPVLNLPANKDLFGEILKRLASTEAPGEFLQCLNLRLRLEITYANSTSASMYSQIFDEERTTTAGQHQGPFKSFRTDTPESDQLQADFTERRAFFDLAYRKAQGKTIGGKTFWSNLAREWTTPKEDSLKELAGEARKAPEIFKLCYIQTLGRYRGQDAAALKLLDFVRSPEESELLGVIGALAGIGTPRAHQEMISALTRPNTSMAAKMEICQRLQGAALTSLQSELRSAISDLSPAELPSPELRDLLESLSNLLTPQGQDQGGQAPQVPATAQETKDLDTVLAGKIPNYRDLSSEVRRALRTAQFFHNQIESAKNASTIDLSPVIDMQYKALELLFRESFEDACSNVINDGVLQRKLDVIGYARPIPQAMDEFEKYIGLIPVIDSIPYFSKFKLRKMLRAICQYRPGRRFTLDGIKAFALFFICFGRKTCKYGLENVVELGFADDRTLCEFCKSLHVFQDFRNRAAHEGFHPEAHNDINGIWRSTAEIIQTAFQIKTSFVPTPKLGHFGGSQSNPKVEYKSPGRRAS